MPYSILHVFSSDVYTGSVAYAVQIAEKQTACGHKVYIVTDMSNLSEKIPSFQLPVSKRSLLHRFKNICFLIQIIRTYHITIIHSHSRAASWISFYAAKILGIPQVATIHGRQIKHTSFFKKANVYGNQTIGICPNLIEHLEKEIKINKNKLTLIPNGIDFDNFKNIKRTRPKDQKIIISVIGRFNGTKGTIVYQLITHVFPFLLKEYPNLHIQLIGGEWDSFPMDGKIKYEELHAKYDGRIINVGFTRNVLDMMANADLVIGAGRVVMKSIVLGVPVIAMGVSCYHGLLTEDNINEAIASNFGDILPQKIDFIPDCPLILKNLRAFLGGTLNKGIGLAAYLKSYNIDNVMNEIMEVYRKAVIQKVHPKHIPILMYHKIPEKPLTSRHRIFVTRRNFKKHLQYFALRGLKSITFKDYYDFLNGDKPLNEFPKKPFFLTFDDGYADNYENALALTQKYNFKGVLFLLGDFNSTHNSWDKEEDPETIRLMTTDQKAAFVKCDWEIGAHTLTHPDLTKVDDQLAKYEICESRNLIEKNLNTKVITFAYPYGITNERVKQFVKEAGFEFGITTNSGGKNTIEEDRFEIFRVNIYPEDGLFQIYKKTSSWYRAYYKKKRGK